VILDDFPEGRCAITTLGGEGGKERREGSGKRRGRSSKGGRAKIRERKRERKREEGRRDTSGRTSGRVRS